VIEDKDVEVCRQCTLKHLSTAMVSLTDEDIPNILKQVYFCGNLAHAANHFVKIDEKIAEDIRALRIDAQDDRLNFTMDIEQIKERLIAVIEAVTTYQPPEPEKVEEPPEEKKEAPVVQKRGCPCHAHK